MADMPKPQSEHRKLHRLVGDWKGKEELHPSPRDPKGGTATGRVQNRSALDGFAVIQNYEQERDGKVNYRGHGVFTWDKSENCYVLQWVDSSGMSPGVFKGTLENNVLTLSNRNLQGHMRAIWDFSQDR